MASGRVPKTINTFFIGVAKFFPTIFTKRPIKFATEKGRTGSDYVLSAYYTESNPN